MAVKGDCLGLIDDPLTWRNNQLAKVGIIASDSANAAISGRKKLAQEIRNIVGNQDQSILHIDCGMHAGSVKNFIHYFIILVC